MVAYIRPHKLEDVKTALAEIGVTGITVTEVRGCGSSPEPSDWHLGKEFVIPLPARIKLETVVTDEMAEAAAAAIAESARTGRPGDGKIVLAKVSDCVRIRTGDRQIAAL